MGYGAIQILTGVTNLSELGIDVAKDWGLFQIKNVGNPSAAKDVVNQETALIWLAAVFNVNRAATIAANTVYQNVTAYPQVVSIPVDFSYDHDSVAEGFGEGYGQIRIGPTNTPSAIVAATGFSQQWYGPDVDNLTLEHFYHTMLAVIPPGYYWEVTTQSTAPGSADVNTKSYVWGAAESGYPP